MSPEAVALVGGLLFLLIAIVGGGFSAKEVMIPGVPRWARIASLAVGMALVVPYFAQALSSDQTKSPDTGNPPELKPAPARDRRGPRFRITSTKPALAS